MSDVPHVAIGDFCQTGSGGTPSRDQMDRYYDGGTIPWVKSGELRESVITSTEEHVTEAALKETSVKLVPENALLVAMYGATVGRLGILGMSATTNQAVCHIVPDPARAEVRYLFRALETKVSEMLRRTVGGAQPNINQGIVRELTIPLPSLPEQRRIAAILDQAEALRTQRRCALAHFDSLTQSLFLDMFGNPVKNLKNWPKLPFSQVCETRLGKMLDAKQQTGENKRRYLRNANVQWFRIDLSDLFEMDFDANARDIFRLEKGDILICEGGEPGRAAIWRGEPEEIYYQKALHRGRPRASVANPEYLVWLLWFLSKHGGLGDHITSATIAHLTGEKLKAMAIPLPPLPLQLAFATRIQAIEALKAKHRAALAELDALFVSLQHRAFTGAL